MSSSLFPSEVSIHAPARGATPGIGLIYPEDFSFNPRSRAGSDHTCDNSLHVALCFNPRSRAGSDSTDFTVTLPLVGFQSTLPRGERPFTTSRIPASLSFQSTLPRGERLVRRSAFPFGFLVSIHAPARGATFHVLRNKSALRRFNPRSRAGSDIIFLKIFEQPRSFNPRSRAGSDLASANAAVTDLSFQSTLPRGERLVCNPESGVALTFQSTLPRGERRGRGAGDSCFV